ncbi:MAG: HdeD family acid-resistance protein [Planctomycetota bacterium]
MGAESENDRNAKDVGETAAGATPWGWFFAFGVILLVLGTAAIAVPLAATVAVELLLGWVFLIGGVAQGVHAFHSRRWGGVILRLLNGALGVVVGLLLLANPLKGVLALTLLLAIFFFVAGALKIVAALQIRSLAHWIWVLVSGVIDLVLGGLIWQEWPGSAVWVLGMLAGISLIFNGWATIAFALAVRSAAEEA